jgi:hypothetical protein
MEALSLEVKWLGWRVVDHSPPSSAQVLNERGYTVITLYAFMDNFAAYITCQAADKVTLHTVASAVLSISSAAGPWPQNTITQLQHGFNIVHFRATVLYTKVYSQGIAQLVLLLLQVSAAKCSHLQGATTVKACTAFYTACKIFIHMNVIP